MTYVYYSVNVSGAVGPRIVDRVINNLSNDSEMWLLFCLEYDRLSEIIATLPAAKNARGKGCTWQRVEE